MSSSVQCFPMLQAFKPESALNMSNIFSTSPSATSSSSSNTIIPTLPTIAPNSANFFEKFLNSQQIDTVAYLQALSQSALTSFSSATLPQPCSTTLSATASVAPPSHQQPSSTFNHLLSNLAATGGAGNDRNVLNLNLNQQKITKRRNRTTFTHEQATALEKEYATDQYMPRSRRAIVADNLSLTEGQVKTWFQNRRAKDKRTDKLNGIQQSNDPSTAAAGSTVSPTSPTQQQQQQQRSIVSGIGSGPKPMIQKPTFDTNFLMPPLNGGLSSPSSSSTTSSNFSANHSPLSPLSPLFGNSNNNSMTFGNIDANSSAATLAALYMQALQLQTSIASTIVSS